MLAARAARTALTALAALAAALPPGCAPASAAPGDTIVLLSSRSIADPARVATQLDELAACTDVLGPARFEVLAAPENGPRDFAEMLGKRRQPPPGERDGLRAAIAIVGDLSLMQGVDPSILRRKSETLTSRLVDLQELDESLARLEDAARRQGGLVIPASAPLGRQGRIEVPELLEVTRHVHARPGFINLQAAFRSLEDERLFDNGIDRLDSSGEAALARSLFDAVCEDPGPVAPRTPAERRARAQARALRALALGRRTQAAAEQAAALELPLPQGPAAAAGARARVRDAALALALEGPGAAADPWSALEGAAPAPGLALAARLIAPQAGGPPAQEPFEAGLVAVLDAVRSRDPQSALLAKELVDDHPERVEAWMLLELAGILASPPTEVRERACAQLALFPHGIVSVDAARTLLDDWPRCLNDLPALYLAQQPFAALDAESP